MGGKLATRGSVDGRSHITCYNHDRYCNMKDGHHAYYRDAYYHGQYSNGTRQVRRRERNGNGTGAEQTRNVAMQTAHGCYAIITDVIPSRRHHMFVVRRWSRITAHDYLTLMFDIVNDYPTARNGSDGR